MILRDYLLKIRTKYVKSSKVISLGSTVEVLGKKYIAHDTGGAIKGNKIDILMATHEEALAFGVQHLEIKIWEG